MALASTVATDALQDFVGAVEQAHRQTSRTVYHVFWQSDSVIEAPRFDWGKGELFGLAAWAWQQHANAVK
jgi:gentisate 1,2-dioxygenase